MEEATIRWMMIGGLSLFFGILLIALWYIKYLRDRDISNKSNKQYDPIFQAMLITLFLVTAMGVFEFFAIIPPGSNKKYAWAYMVGFIGLVLYFYWRTNKLMPYPLEKQKMIAEGAVKVFFDVEKYRGLARIPPILLYRVTEGIGGMVGNFLVVYMVDGTIKTAFLVKISIYPPGTVLHVQPNPPQSLIDSFIGDKLPVAKYETFIKKAIDEDDKFVEKAKVI